MPYPIEAQPRGGGARFIILAAAVAALTHCAPFAERSRPPSGALDEDGTEAEAYPLAEWTASTVAVNQTRPSWLTLDGESVFWTNVVRDADGRAFGQLTRMDRTEGATPRALASGIENPQDLALDADRVFWLEGTGAACADSAVGSIAKDGAAISSVGVTCYRGRAVRVDDIHIYVLGNLGEIVRRSKDGATQVPLEGNEGVAMSLALGPETVYFGSRTGIQQISKAAQVTGTKRLFAADTDTIGLVTDATHVYWASPVRGTLQRLDAGKSGQQPQVLAGDLRSPTAVALDSQSVYVASAGDGTVRRVDKAGGLIEEVVSGLKEPCGLAADDAAVYVADCATGVLTVLRRR